MTEALAVVGLTKRYPEFLLDGVNITIPTGYVMGFVGPNGAGKTTTLKAILGIVKPDAGVVRLFGGPAGAAAVNQRVGVVMDNPYYPEGWTARDVGEMAGLFYERWSAPGFARQLDQFGISATKKISELSRGMRVKLQLAVALSHGADLLVLDEPTSGLDPVARDELRNMLHDFVADEAHTVLFSTHITQDLERTADYITLLFDGRVVFSGELEALSNSYLRVSGDVDRLTPADRADIIGYRARGGVFEGMVPADKAAALPPDLLTEAVTIDEIVVYLSQAKEPSHV
ncbi:MAG: ABC transporter ATP-binding protein [Propionibacteriaceae bacterium]|nr:ABC transporter ATP-binding protein [Propionibacteriaceae bacterium]